MNKEQIIKIAVEAAAEFIEKQRQKDIQLKKNKQLHNTRLLLKNYWMFKSHCEKSVYRLSQAVDTEKALDILDIIDRYDDKAFIGSIKQSVAKTHIIITHIDTMMRFYKIYCEASNKPEDLRRYRVLHAFYFEHESIGVIAERESIDTRTAWRDIRDACHKLGALIFGIESLGSVS